MEVPASEPTRSRLHVNLRSLVAFLANGVIQFGQVMAVREDTDVDPAEMVVIQSGTGRRWVPLRETIGISPVGYALMYDQQVDASGHFNLARVHQVCAQVETAVFEGARDISAIMINVISDQPVDPL